jgi:hypothetical protein
LIRPSAYYLGTTSALRNVHKINMVFLLKKKRLLFRHSTYKIGCKTTT